MAADGFAVVDPAEVEQEPCPESGTIHRKLTEPLGCAEMRVNTATLQPGHRERGRAARQQ